MLCRRGGGCTRGLQVLYKAKPQAQHGQEQGLENWVQDPTDSRSCSRDSRLTHCRSKKAP